ncbi:MAG: squalene/phytoene synthase family protein [Akkermansia sp.]|nr:squalene/phytoene synthase family protein [Akkermansia sp.]
MKHGTDLTGELLKAVSRSFYLTIYWLPQAMRSGVALGYMLARATDSVADTSSAAPELRVCVLLRMRGAIAGTDSAEERVALLEDLSCTMAEAQQNPAESTLLRRFGDCLAALQTFPAEQQACIRKVLHTIIEGQLWDITYFRKHNSVDTDEQTINYTYLVAGCVGEFWTELGYAAMGTAFCAPDKREDMLRAGIRYGQGLQLINILRDREEDARRGRSYLCSDAKKWLNRADYYMNDGIDYCQRLRGFRLRFAGMLPALIGKKTIALLRRARPEDGRVKIPRSAVYGCMLKAVWLSLAGRAS